ncbi:MAG: PAS domain S-box protein [Candidatus Manganitrophus sp. SA1]|nr:PAS domain S-box protein [Candidatus Manganitrophus morganii]
MERGMDREKIDAAIIAIMKEIGISAEEVARRKAYLKLEDHDVALLKEFHEQQARTSVLVDAFYEHLLSFEETRALLPDADTLMRLKQVLALYFDRLTAGDYGDAYIQNRLRIGLTHQQIGLAPKWYFGAYAQCLAELLPKMWQTSEGDAGKFIETYRAALKIVFLDMGLAIDAYRHADQQATRAAKDHLQNVISSVPLGMLLLSGDLQIISANLAFREMMGDPEKEFRGRSLFEVLPTSDLAEWATQVLGGGVHQCQTIVDINDLKGDRRLQMITMRGVRYTEGDRARLLLVVEDITERQKADQAVRESRDLMLDFLENANDLIQSVTPDGRFQYVNRAWLEALGYEQEDLPHLTLSDLFHPDNQTHCEALFERIKNGESLRSAQMVFVTKSGRPIAVEGNINSRIENGKTVITRAIFRDVTERKQAEEELRNAEAFLNSIIENIPNMLFVKEVRELRFVRFNKAGEALLGYPREELIGKNDYDLFPEAQADFFTSKDRQVLGEGKLLDIPEEPIQTRDRGTRILHTRKIPLYDKEGRPLYLLGISEDITERKRAEDALRESKERFQLATRATNDVIWDWDLITNALWWSENFAPLLGLRLEEIQPGAESWTDRIHPDDKRRILSDVHEAIDRGGQFWSGEYRFRRGDGTYATVLDRGYIVRDEAGAPVRMIGAMMDNTERRRAEENLRQSEERFRQVAESIREVFWMTSTDKNEMIYVSPAYQEVWGVSPRKLYEEPRAWLDTIHPEDRARVIAAFPKQATGEYDLQYRIIRPDGSIRWIRDRAFPIRNAAGAVYRVAGIAEDITERKQDEEALQRAYKDLKETQAYLLQSEKMASLGQMAAGVAHEINNPIGFVSSNLRTLEEYMTDLLQLVGGYESLLTAVEGGESDAIEGEKRRVRSLSKQVNVGFLLEDLSRLVEQSLDGMERVRRIVQDLKEFSHVGRAERMRMNLNQGIESTLNIVWSELKYKAEVIKELGGIPEILCYPQQINQVFMNLLVNAAHAISERGKIWIRSRVEGNWIVVEIEDTGCGISEEHVKKIFDPFFTTKPVGKGTGLGLSVSYRIVQKHNGKIEVESTVGKGTKFRLLLPMDEST